MSFKLGDIGENLWLNHIRKTHTNIETSKDKGRFLDWDIKGTYKSREITYEVKYDVSGYKYAKNRPVNLYIEYENTTKGEDSGIKASEAHYYVYILKSLDGKETAYVFKRSELLDHLKENEYPIKENKAGGDDNAKGWTPPLYKLKGILKKEIEFKK